MGKSKITQEKGKNKASQEWKHTAFIPEAEAGE